MRISFNILLALCSLILVGCVKDLDRDNPLDEFYGFDGVGVLSVASHLIESDNNYDHIANPGESIKLNIKVRNATKKDVHGVNIKVSTNSPYISNIKNPGPIDLYQDGWSSAFYISKDGLGEVNSTSSYFGFDIASNTPIGTLLRFNVVITDENGETWDDTIEITVVGVNGHISVKSFVVYSDNNYDKKINKGETIKLNVILENLGSSKVNKVKATFSTDNQYITNLVNHQNISYYEDGWSSADYILAGSYGEVNSSNQHFGFDVDQNTPEGTVVVFDVNSTDESGGLWTDTFSIRVVYVDGDISVKSHSVYSDNNYDKKINKGETVKLNVILENLGSSKVNKVKATFSTDNQYITNLVNHQNISYYDDGWSSADYILAGSTGEVNSSNQHFGFDVDENTPDGTVIVFDVNSTDETGGLWTDTFSVQVKKIDAILTVQSHTVSFDDNYNNKVNSGESVRLNIQIKNEGTSRALGVKASITTESSYVTNMVRNNLISYYEDGWSSADYILSGSYGETGSSSSNFGFDIKENTPLGSVITFNVTLTDETNNVWHNSFNIIVE